MPGIQIGSNGDVAWTHTVSKGHRFTMARLDLVPGSPTTYRFGDEERRMTPTAHRVEVLDEPDVERTTWRSHHGPMLNLPLLGWGHETGFTYRDANLDNRAAFPTWLGLMHARSIDDVRDAFAEHQGIPWVNTLAVDRTGRTFYIDGSATPNLGPAAQQRFVDRLGTDPVAALLFENRVALVDGSDPDDEWVEVDGARSPGLVPHDRQPRLERDDVIVNANDSAWSTNIDEPLTGYHVLHGLERVPISQRTRRNHVAARAVAAEGATIDTALAAMFDNVSGTASLAPAVAERLRIAGLARAADALDGWDGRYELTSRGAALWRELMAGFTVAQLTDVGPLWAEAFDPDDPLGTPRGLAPAPPDGPDPIVTAAEAALDLLDRAGVAPDAPLGEVQWVARGTTRVPMHGGSEPDAVANIMTPAVTLSATTLQPRWSAWAATRNEASGPGSPTAATRASRGAASCWPWSSAPTGRGPRASSPTANRATPTGPMPPSRPRRSRHDAGATWRSRTPRSTPTRGWNAAPSAADRRGSAAAGRSARRRPIGRSGAGVDRSCARREDERHRVAQETGDHRDHRRRGVGDVAIVAGRQGRPFPVGRLERRVEHLEVGPEVLDPDPAQLFEPGQHVDPVEEQAEAQVGEQERPGLLPDREQARQVPAHRGVGPSVRSRCRGLVVHLHRQVATQRGGTLAVATQRAHPCGPPDARIRAPVSRPRRRAARPARPGLRAVRAAPGPRPRPPVRTPGPGARSRTGG